ncbi:MAG: hypothetical protein AAGF96_07430 [Bacteroidota bacterium]
MALAPDAPSFTANYRDQEIRRHTSENIRLCLKIRDRRDLRANTEQSRSMAIPEATDTTPYLQFVISFYLSIQ